MKMSEWQSLVMRNFDVPASASGSIRVPCKHCSTFIAGTTKTPANFLKHLKRKHLSIFVKLSTIKQTAGSLIPDTPKTTSSSENQPSVTPPKKQAYTLDFKRRVLEYFLKNGGESSFGLKSKTAQRFNIDKKTINRMLLNPELVAMVEKVIKSSKSSMHHNRKKSKPNKYKKTDSDSSSSVPSPQLNNMPSNEDDVPVLDLPEDPDYSILKKAIRTSANEVSGIAQILASGTPEVQSVLLEECDIILECKVCRNLFRSMVNLLAHKRIYCSQRYRNVRNAYEQNNTMGLSSETSSEVVTASKPKKSKGIDQIAEKLALKTGAPVAVPSTSNKGSSAFYNSILKTQENRDKDKRTCSVVLTELRHAKGVASQDITCNDKTIVTRRSQDVLQQANERKEGATAVIGPEGTVISTFFGEPKGEEEANREIARLEATETESVESDERTLPGSMDDKVSEIDDVRTIYTCPICSTQFLSVGGCLKHLTKVHKKKKQHRETLRTIIVDRSHKRKLTAQEKASSHLKGTSSSPTEPPPKKLCTEKDTVKPVPVAPVPEEEQAPIRENSTQQSLPNSCPKCKRNFMSGGALGSHIKFCQFPMSPLAPHDMPEKKIAIQIRKDYSKEGWMSPPHSSSSEPFAKLLLRRSLSEDMSSSTEVSTEAFTQEFDRRVSEVSSSLERKIKNGKIGCVPCSLKFNKRAHFKNHAAKHLSCTRFLCGKCKKYRSYHRYTMNNHLQFEHDVSLAMLSEFVLFVPKFGDFVFKLRRLQENRSDTSIGDKMDKPPSESVLNIKTIQVNKFEAATVNKSSIVKTENLFERIPKVKIERLDLKNTEISTFSAEQDPDASTAELVEEQLTDSKPEEKPLKKEEESKEDANANKLCTVRLTCGGNTLQTPINISKRIKITSIKTKEFVRCDNTFKEKPIICKEIKIDNGRFELPMVEPCHTASLAQHENTSKQERPQRVRRSVEKKDFIYDIRRTGSPVVEEDIHKMKDKKKSVDAVHHKKTDKKANPDVNDGSTNGWENKPVDKVDAKNVLADEEYNKVNNIKTSEKIHKSESSSQEDNIEINDSKKVIETDLNHKIDENHTNISEDYHKTNEINHVDAAKNPKETCPEHSSDRVDGCSEGESTVPSKM